jgi:hypothetical protein
MAMFTLTRAVFVAGLLAPSAALACKCSATPRAAMIEKTPYVFQGRVLRVRDDETTRYADIEMVRPVKGEIPRVMEVATPRSTAACGYPFQKGQVLVVGVSLREAQYHANNCTMLSLNGGK